MLPLLLYQWIPEGNTDWELFCDLMTIVDIFFAPVIAKGTTTYLRLIISEYLQEFMVYLVDNTALHIHL